MGRGTFSRAAYDSVRTAVTRGGTRSATHDAEERIQSGKGMDPLIDPKGPAHLGAIRRSLPRFDRDEDLWRLTVGIPMNIEELLDTTGSMGNNVELAFDSLPQSYAMLTSGRAPLLKGYDVQIATGTFNDVQDDRRRAPIFCRTQFEMNEKIAQQMTLLVPGKGGCGNGKEDPQFGLFGAAYLTDARLTAYGLKGYHFTISDEHVVETIDLRLLKQVFGADVLERIKETGWNFDERNLPDTVQTVSDLKTRAHRFFLFVDDDLSVKQQWTELYGRPYVVTLTHGTAFLHCVQAVIIGLTEGVLDLTTAEPFLREHKVDKDVAVQIVKDVSHIPLGVQAQFPNYGKLPKAGDLFKSKTDLWPIDPKTAKKPAKGEKSGKKTKEWL